MAYHTLTSSARDGRPRGESQAAPAPTSTGDTTHEAEVHSKSDINSILIRTSSKSTTQPPSNIAESPASLYSNSPARSVNFGFASAQGLTKSNSTASAGRNSVTSHISLPVTGTIPYGALQVHRVSDPNPETSSTDSVVQPFIPEAAPTPPPKCLEQGDVFLLLDLPDHSIVGHDAMALTIVDAKVSGIRDIPPGAHLLWVSEPTGIFRFGYWYVAGDNGVVRIKQWNRFSEVLGEPASQFEARDKKDHIETIYPRLVPHDYSGGDSHSSGPPPPPPKGPSGEGSDAESDLAAARISLWQQLTSSITRDFLGRVAGKADASEWLVETTDEAAGDSFPQRTNNVLRLGTEGQLNFLFAEEAEILPRLDVASASEYFTDSTPRLVSILNGQPPAAVEADIIAEFQFTFLTGMHLGNHACVQQWRYILLKIFLRAYRLTSSHPSLCRALLQTLHAQLIYDERYLARPGSGNSAKDNLDAGILDVIPGTKNKLHAALTVYKRRLDKELLGLGAQATPEQASVGHAFASLETWLWRHGWDLRSECEHGKHQLGVVDGDDSDEEYNPVVVQLDESGREVGLVSWSKD